MAQTSLVSVGLDGTYTCNFSIGYGAESSKVRIGYQRGNVCINACLHMKKIDPTINGVTVYADTDRGGCWCEQHMKRIRGRFKTCFLESDRTEVITGKLVTCSVLFISSRVTHPGEGKLPGQYIRNVSMT